MKGGFLGRLGNGILWALSGNLQIKRAELMESNGGRELVCWAVGEGDVSTHYIPKEAQDEYLWPLPHSVLHHITLSFTFFCTVDFATSFIFSLSLLNMTKSWVDWTEHCLRAASDSSDQRFLAKGRVSRGLSCRRELGGGQWPLMIICSLLEHPANAFISRLSA